MQDTAFWMLVTGYSLAGRSRRRSLVTGCWILDARCWMTRFQRGKKIKNNHDHFIRLDERGKGRNKNIFSWFRFFVLS